MISEGCIVVAELPQADGNSKARPILLLRELPGFGDYLACGISTQVHQTIEGFDELISDSDSSFEMTGLRATSVIRLNFVSTVPKKRMSRLLGHLDSSLLAQLKGRLARHITG